MFSVDVIALINNSFGMRKIFNPYLVLLYIRLRKIQFLVFLVIICVENERSVIKNYYIFNEHP
jgi:hypothetical protein